MHIVGIRCWHIAQATPWRPYAQRFALLGAVREKIVPKKKINTKIERQVGLQPSNKLRIVFCYHHCGRHRCYGYVPHCFAGSRVLQCNCQRRIPLSNATQETLAIKSINTSKRGLVRLKLADIIGNIKPIGAGTELQRLGECATDNDHGRSSSTISICRHITSQI
ncbi:hypothetical protein CRV24_007461 [Beauveria bassiana]|nr:hypothetical protein CRV24_007461 [Beauveria bassiana]